MTAQALSRRIRQTRQTTKVEQPLILAKTFSCRIGKFGQATELYVTLMTAQALSRRIRQTRQATKVERILTTAEDLGRLILNRCELAESHVIVTIQKLLSNLFGQYFLVAHGYPQNCCHLIHQPLIIPPPARQSSREGAS